jgi:cortactin
LSNTLDYSAGFGGKYGVQKERQDKSAEGWDYQAKREQHASQKDYATGFGGKYGVQTDRQDQSAEGWDYQAKLEQHTSQKDYSTGFGGKYGVQKDRQDEVCLNMCSHSLTVFQSFSCSSVSLSLVCVCLWCS